MNGARSDITGVAKLAREWGALVMLDDYQDCGTRPIDVKAHLTENQYAVTAFTIHNVFGGVKRSDISFRSSKLAKSSPLIPKQHAGRIRQILLVA